MTIRSVAVLGAGTMGAQIAAHFANAGVQVLLLDLTAEAAQQGLQRAKTLKPDPFFTADTINLIQTGGFDADLARLAEADWIIEAIVEVLDVKRALLERVDRTRRPGSIVSSNTSGISIAALADGRSDDFRHHWLGTHFFNPPRYLRLLEVIPTADTKREAIEVVRHFADYRLGKGVVIAKDSPGFIGNHIGMFGLLAMLEKVANGEYTIEEADAISGPAIGRPRSATFRTMDIAGIDIVAHVVADMRRRLPSAAAETFVLPDFVQKMVDRGLTGEKAGAGFYKRVRKADGTSDILVIDPATLEYRPQQKPKLPSLDSTATIPDVRERVRTLAAGGDRVGSFLRDTLIPTLQIPGGSWTLWRTPGTMSTG